MPNRVSKLILQQTADIVWRIAVGTRVVAPQNDSEWNLCTEWGRSSTYTGKIGSLSVRPPAWLGFPFFLRKKKFERSRKQSPYLLFRFFLPFSLAWD
jgi:hypothetical protein